MPDLDAWVRRPVTKIISVAPPPRPESLLPRAVADFAGRADPTVSHPTFLEFLAPGVNKGLAVRFLARRLGVDLRDVLAIGDQLNDREMIAEVGTGVAMSGSPEALSAVARIVAPPLEEEGAAQVLEELVLRRRAPRAGLTWGHGRARAGPATEEDGASRMGQNGHAGRPASRRQCRRSR